MPVPDSRFPIISFILIYAPFILTSQYSLYADNINSLLSLNALHADDIGKARN